MKVYITYNGQTNTYNIRSMDSKQVIASALSERETKRICKSRHYQVYGIICYE